MGVREVSVGYADLSLAAADTVPQGYKQTEVGLIPEDWEIQPLGALFSFKNGLNKSKRFFGQGTPIVNYMDVYNRSALYASDIRGRVDVSRQELDAFCVRRGDVFFTRTSETVEEIGVSSVLLENMRDTVFSGFVLRGRPKDNSLIDAFKKYCFSSRIFRAQIVSKSTYTTRALTNGRVLSGIQLALPPNKAEQEVITAALNDADALIESLQQLIAKKRQIKQGAMQTLLTGEQRLPGFSGKWMARRLGSVLKFQVGFPFSSSMFNTEGQGIRLVRNRDLKSDDQAIYYSGPSAPEFNVCNGDVLVSMDGDFRPCLWMKGTALLNQRVGRVVPLKGFESVFFFYFLQGPLKEIEEATSGTTVKHLSHSDIENIEKPLPDGPEQFAIATVLADMDAEIDALETRLGKTREIKQGMMQALLTGAIRLPLVETA